MFMTDKMLSRVLIFNPRAERALTHDEHPGILRMLLAMKFIVLVFKESEDRRSKNRLAALPARSMASNKNEVSFERGLVELTIFWLAA